MIDPLLIGVVADIVTDLSAAAFAAVLLVPISAERPREQNITLARITFSWACLDLQLPGCYVCWWYEDEWIRE